ncbi:MAG: hypothetical protein ACJAWV_003911 [Flammeovirgaceae bacterium]|jgi:hypothetical protein
MSSISFLSHNPTLTEKLGKLLQNSDYELVHFKIGSDLLIIEPLLIAEEYFTVSTFWRVWLEKNSPNSKLITASFFEQVGDSNHICLTQFPADFSTFLEQAKSISEFSEQKILGKNILGKIRKFLDGHGEESLLKMITELKSQLDTMLFLLMDDAELEQVLEVTWQGDGEILHEQLLKRMEEYKSYFQYLPLWEDYKNTLSEIQNFQPNSEEGIRQFTQIVSDWSEKLRNNFDLRS